MKNVLFVLTSHSSLGNTGKETGFWLEEFATPYYVVKDHGARLTVCSVDGGAPPIDPASKAEAWQTDSTRRFWDDQELLSSMQSTKSIDEIDPKDFDAVFFPGGHGPMWDMANNDRVATVVEHFYKAGKPVAAVCHGVAALVGPKGEDSKPLVVGRNVCCFSDSEENAVGLSNVVPFSLQKQLAQLGANVLVGDDFAEKVIVDGKLITGQNPQSSEGCAQQLVKQLV